MGWRWGISGPTGSDVTPAWRPRQPPGGCRWCRGALFFSFIPLRYGLLVWRPPEMPATDSLLLVVDGNPHVLQMLEYALTLDGFRVRTAATLEAAVTACRRYREEVGLVLLDVDTRGARE